ncbi:hypothetical protein [Maricaulis sp.]|uniref:hypothetical protein n=1 Tax=Maricaulis sp. TaxID=1486257 RepID=UPI003A8CC1B5
MSKRVPPSLACRKTEFDRMCEVLGGPIDLGPTVNSDVFNRACSQTPYGKVANIVRPYSVDETAAKRHWPWVAFALSQYEFEVRELERYRHTELSPSQTIQLLERIQSGADKLAADLCHLQTLANRLDIPGQPDVRGHLSWLDSFLSQAIAGEEAYDLNDSPEALMRHYNQRRELLHVLASLAAAAEAAVDRVGPQFLSKARPTENPALHHLVFRLGQVWASLTGRSPSANKVAGGLREPDFVVFVASLSAMVCDANVTRVKVQTALRTLKTNRKELG